MGRQPVKFHDEPETEQRLTAIVHGVFTNPLEQSLRLKQATGYRVGAITEDDKYA